MPIEIRELVIKAVVSPQETETRNESRNLDQETRADRFFEELMNIKKLIEQKNER
jgi:uncharacterized protein DUF5908